MSLTTKQEHVTTTGALCMISKRHELRRFHSASPLPRQNCLEPIPGNWLLPGLVTRLQTTLAGGGGSTVLEVTV